MLICSSFFSDSALIKAQLRIDQWNHKGNADTEQRVNGKSERHFDWATLDIGRRDRLVAVLDQPREQVLWAGTDRANDDNAMENTKEGNVPLGRCIIVVVKGWKRS